MEKEGLCGGGCGKALGAGQGVRAAKTLPWPQFSSWGFEEELGCCREGPALSLLWFGGAGCFPKLSSARAAPIPPQGLSWPQEAAGRGLELLFSQLGLKVGCAPRSPSLGSWLCSPEGGREGCTVLPSSSASWVTLDLSLLLPVPVSPSAPSSLALAARFPGSVCVREDEELQTDAQLSQPQAESRFSPPETPQFPLLPPFPAL